jgi:hypothetical protein
MAPVLDPEIADLAPWSESLTDYDLQHLVVYLRLLDARRDEADWREVALLVLHRDAAQDEASARACWETHLKRAEWMTTTGYKDRLTAKTGQA